ncbi:sulfite oxidase heme-binding subunit YedZ [Paracoccus pacificus]|uniref:Protein-methionine-sulfoxide reductase heme-binding subunit MsrQ n=1 Tax=Paracoccus pacificus TaxID=1463598 RepID=A0ABW4R3W9_9RHOB
MAHWTERAQQINSLLRKLPVWAIWIAGLVPLGLLVWDVLNGQTGPDPIRDIEHRLGRTALYFLVGGLAVTPLQRISRISLIRFRRALGLIAFTYAGLHVLAWIWLDMGLMWQQALNDVIKRPYLFLGMIAFLILLALAVTSNDLSMRRMRSGWKDLHQLVYVAAPVVALHWLWALKVWERWPLSILAAILLLVALRPLIPRPLRWSSKPNGEKITVKTTS